MRRHHVDDQRLSLIRHPVPVYFAADVCDFLGRRPLAIGGSGGMRGTTPASDPRFAYALIAMLAGPSVTGLLLTALVYGRAGLREFRSRVLKWRVGATWYAVALLTAPVVMTATLLALVVHLSGVSPGHLHFGSEGVASARRPRGGTVGRHLRGTGVDGVRDPRR